MEVFGQAIQVLHKVKLSHRRHNESMCRLLGVLKLALIPLCPKTLALAVNFIPCCKKILKIISKLCLKAVSPFNTSRH